MPGLVGQFPVSAFTDPQSGQQKNVSVIRGNDNTVGAAITGHDASATIHVQSSTLASRPAAGTAQRFWVTTDGKRAYLDNGTTWDELVYVPIVGSAAKLPYGSVPGSPADGDTWVTSAGLFTRVAGVTKGPFTDTIDVTGSGTAGKVSRWTAGTTLGNAAMSDDGTFTSNANNPRARRKETNVGVPATAAALGWASYGDGINVGIMWASGFPTRFTVPTGAGGTYDLSLSLAGIYAPSTGTTLVVSLRKNGSTTIGLVHQIEPTAGVIGTALTIVSQDEAVAADYYEWLLGGSGVASIVVAQAVTSIRKVW